MFWTIPISCFTIMSLLGLTTWQLYSNVEDSSENRIIPEGASPKETMTTEYPYPEVPYPQEIGDPEAFLEELILEGSSRYPEVNNNYKNIQFILPPVRQSSNKSVDVVILIQSMISNAHDRNLHRKYWANENLVSKFSGLKVKFAFLIGRPPADFESKDVDALQEEIATYGDFVQGDFLDDSIDSTLKTMAGIIWTRNTFIDYKFLVFVKSDTYFSLKNLLQYLRDPAFYPVKRRRSLLKSNNNPLPLVQLSKTDFYAGSVSDYGYSLPTRSYSEGAMILTYEEYEPLVFPAHVRSPLIILSKKTVSKFYLLSAYVQHLYIDEVFLGILANKLKIPALDTQFVVDQEYLRINFTPSSLETYENAICLYNLLPENREALWTRFK